MKILHALTGAGVNAGGTSEVVPRLCRALKDGGHDVALVMAHVDEEYSEEMKLALAAGVTIVEGRGFWNWIGYFGRDAELMERARAIVAPYDIVHIHGLWQPPQWFIARACRQLGKPYVMMTHGFLEPARLKISKWKKRLVGWLVERRNLICANAIVATAESEALGIRQYGLKNPIHVMPIGLDVEKFAESREERVESGEEKVESREEGKDGKVGRKRRLLYFSRITPIKGLDMLVEAWAQLKEFHDDWELAIVGPDDRGYTRELQAYINSLGLSYKDETSTVRLHLSPSPAITFPGPAYGEAKYAMLRSADVFVLPTRSENWSIAVAEAMATGLPVVCTKGAPWSCIEECRCGHWVDISVESIADGLRDVLAMTDDARRAMGLRGRDWVVRHLGWRQIADEMTAFYQGVMAC